MGNLSPTCFYIVMLMLCTITGYTVTVMIQSFGFFMMICVEYAAQGSFLLRYRKRFVTVIPRLFFTIIQMSRAQQSYANDVVLRGDTTPFFALVSVLLIAF